MNNGWISLHRKITKWEWYDDANTFRVFIHCLLLANHEKKKWRGNVVERGQLITSQAHLANDLNLSIKAIRTCLDKLKTTGELAVKTTNKYSIISITNYDSMQNDGRQIDTQAAGKGQSKDTQAAGKGQQTITTTTKEPKNDNKREGAKRFASPSLKKIQEYISEKGYHVNAETFFNHYESNGWKVGKNPMKSWKAALANWSSREKSDSTKPMTEKERFYAEMRGEQKQTIEGECSVVK